ncbi:MAG: MFS transporter [Deltaproteobacteria bacterium]|jgi:predicted MFS family arabinose efflux permease|nr:MFS transporter [Deltaproteobacteria bacterium]
MMIMLGTRQTIGLFVHPLLDATTMNIAEMSMAIAIGQLMWGVFQPLFGIWADKHGAFPVLLTGALLLFCGQICTMWATSFLPMTLAQGLLSPAGSAALSFTVLIAVVGRRLPSEKMSMAGGIINAGGSLGQFIFSPIVQGLISMRGYAGSLMFLAFTALASIVPSWLLSRQRAKPSSAAPATPQKQPDAIDLKTQLRTAFRDPSYLLLHTGFFTCGFHVAFLTTHLPGEISMCGHSDSVSAISLSIIGLCNIAGSIMAGVLGKRFRMKYILASLYGFRAMIIAAYLFSPKTEWTFYIFAVTTGFTWLATVPPTAGIVGKLYGTRYLATLFGLTFFTHQAGGFLGAWLGGVAIQASGSLLWVWWVDIALAIVAAVVNLPIREKKPV